jgi:iron complex outermembrane receptor protein
MKNLLQQAAAMKTGRAPRRFLHRSAAVLAVALVSPILPAGAQQETEPIVKLEKVEVTGSHIARTEIESALPVQVITREDIERSGATTVAEMMAQVSANIVGNNDRMSAGGAGVPGLSSVNLRGIGSGSTLVLLNGRRVANYAFDGGAVDVNSIPLSAVERVEILKDGASAIYGTDAIAGVVNFILRKDFQGLEATAYGGWTEHGGGNQAQATLTAGYGDLAKDRFNIFATMSYQKDQALANTARPYTRTGYLPDEGIINLSPNTFPANIFAMRDLHNPSYASGCAPPSSLPFSDMTACGFDFVPLVNAIPPVERWGAFARGAFQLNADHLLFAELGYLHNEMTIKSAPMPASQFTTTTGDPLLYPEGGPYYPTAFAAANGISGDLNLFYRTIPLGPRVTEVTSSAWRAVVGAEGTAAGWTYGGALTYSRNQQGESLTSGWVSVPRLIAGFATGLINPFGPSGPEGDALLAATQLTGEAHTATGTTVQLDARGSKEVWDLPGGPLAIAVGGEARRERLDNQFASFITSGELGGLASQPVAATRNVGSLFVEAIVPILKTVEAQLAARYDHYSDFGGTTNPKVALRWQPLPTLMLRSSWGTGFRAPTLYDVYTPQQSSTVDIFPPPDDPVRCPVTRSPQDCNVFFPTASGGNPTLQPETSEQFNAGAVWEPVKGLSLTVDYWKINKNNYIGQLSADEIFSNFAYYEPTNIVRGPVDPAYPGLPGPIQTVLLLNQNLGHLRTSGFDVDVNWRGPVTSFGRLSFGLNGTYVSTWELQQADLTYVSGVGRLTVGGPVPHWRHYASLNWDYGPWGATLAQTYQSGFEDANNTDPPQPPRRVSPYDIWNVQGRYAGFRNTTIVVGIKNLMDRAPPFTNVAPAGWDPIYADPRGRVFYAQLTYAFK